MSAEKWDYQTLHSVVCTLTEAALRDQELCKKAIFNTNHAAEKMHKISDSLPQLIAQQVERRIITTVQQASEDILMKQLKSANLEAERAAKVYKRAAESGSRNIALMTMGITSLAIIAMVTVAWLVVTPSLAEIQARREEKAFLESQMTSLKAGVASLEKWLAKRPVRRCTLANGKDRLCARLDQNFPDGWGDEQDYRIIQNE